MKRQMLIAICALTILAPFAQANPIPWPSPASMPLEEMWIDIRSTQDGLHADFVGDFTFNYIPLEVGSMSFPVPPDSTNIGVYQDGAALPWWWRAQDCYTTVLPEMPCIPMAEWAGPFPEDGAVFTVEYEHDLIERPGEFIYFYAIGTGRYFPTYQKTVKAVFDISLPPGVRVNGVWLDETPVSRADYQISGTHMTMTLTAWFGPFTKDLIISLVPQFPLQGDADLSGYVDDDDLSLLLSHWQKEGGWYEGDFNGDHIVDDDDLNLLLAAWNQYLHLPPPAPSPVPEPATALLLLLGLSCAARRRMRR